MSQATGCRATVRGVRCGKPCVPGRSLCPKHLTAAQRRERQAVDEAEAARVALAKESGRRDPVSDILDGQAKSAQEILTSMITAKYQEIEELRRLAREDGVAEGDMGYGLRVTRKEQKTSTIGLGGRESKIGLTTSQSIYLSKLWEAERDLVKMLGATVNIDTQEALVKAQVRSRREYLNDLREAIEASRSLPDATADEILERMAMDARRRAGE